MENASNILSFVAMKEKLLRRIIALCLLRHDNTPAPLLGSDEHVCPRCNREKGGNRFFHAILDEKRQIMGALLVDAGVC